MNGKPDFRADAFYIEYMPYPVPLEVFQRPVEFLAANFKTQNQEPSGRQKARVLQESGATGHVLDELQKWSKHRSRGARRCPLAGVSQVAQQIVIGQDG